MKRMKVVAALATALMVGIAPCMATESVVVTAVENTEATAVTEAPPLTSAPAVEPIVVIELSEPTAAVGRGGMVNGNAIADSTPATPTPTVNPPSTEHPDSEMDFWRDVDAQRGEIVRVEYEGDHTFNNLKVESSTAFQSFRTQVEPDQSITVFVPHFFTGASQVSPVFRVSDRYGEIDTFSVSVEYPRPHSNPDEDSSPLFRLISDIAFRLPQVPFISQLFDD